MLNVQFHKVYNHLSDQYIVYARLMNQQTLEYNKLCDYLADGSTVTATDVSAVMKQIEKKLPFLLGLNVKAICSPEGLTFRPTVTGSITQSQLKKRLEERLAADPTADIDVNREIETSDLTIDDIVATIDIDLPKKWLERFHAEAEFKRVAKGAVNSADETPDGGGSNTDGTDDTDNAGGGSNTDGTDDTDHAGGGSSGDDDDESPGGGGNG